jgi:hypothetical protein
MMKAKLLELQFPVIKSGIGGKQRLKPIPSKRDTVNVDASLFLQRDGHQEMILGKEMSGASKGHYRQQLCIMGSPTGGDPYGDGASIVVRARESLVQEQKYKNGVNGHRNIRNSRRREAGLSDGQIVRYA